MADGGLIVVRPPADLACPANKAAVVGMSSGYGATGGEMYVRGKAALRFMAAIAAPPQWSRGSEMMLANT